MSWLTRQLRDTATYWGAPQVNLWGDQTYPSPATLSCHWEERMEKFFDATGAEAHSHAIIITATRLSAGGFLYRGSSSVVNPRNQVGADLIRQVSEVPSIRTDISTYRVML